MSTTDALLNLDFAALRTLRLVYRLGSFSAAAESIEVKQSTVSYTIDRIRKVVGDPLFVRVGGQNVATDKCREIMPVVDQILLDAEFLMSGKHFNPAEYSGDFTIACASYAKRVIVPQLLRRIRSICPKLRLELRTGYSESFEKFFEDGADIVLHANQAVSSGIYTHRLFNDDYPVCVMDKNNPWAGRTLSIDDLRNAEHVIPKPYRSFQGAYEREIKRRKIPINVPIIVTEVDDIPDCINGTNLIAPMPGRMAATYGDRLGYALFPFEVNTKLDMYWSATSNRSKINTLIRELVLEENEALGPPPTI